MSPTTLERHSGRNCARLIPILSGRTRLGTGLVLTSRADVVVSALDGITCDDRVAYRATTSRSHDAHTLHVSSASLITFLAALARSTF